MIFRRFVLGLGMAGAALMLAACDPNAPRTSSTAYYDSLLWHDYYRGCYRCGPPRPTPPRPVHPIEPPFEPMPPMPMPPVSPPIAVPLPSAF